VIYVQAFGDQQSQKCGKLAR